MDFGLFLDIFVGIVVFASVLIAFFRGFIREVLTIFGIVGGMIAAYIGGPLLSPSMRGWLGVTEGAEEPEKFMGVLEYTLLADILAYGVILIVVVLVLSIISHFLAEFVKNIGLGALDRTLGVVFGLVRAVFVLGLLYLLPYYVITDNTQKEELLGNSKTRVYLEATAAWMDGFIPKEATAKMQEGMGQVKEMSEMQKKLEEMNVLTPSQDSIDQTKAAAEKAKDGYTEEFRNKMDELIEDQVDDGRDVNQ